MNNIEQIKKDWEKHCKGYDVTPIIQDIFKNVTLTTKHNRRSEIIVRYGCKYLLIEDNRDYKLFTSFYEKLIGANEDSERLINEQDND